MIVAYSLAFALAVFWTAPATLGHSTQPPTVALTQGESEQRLLEERQVTETATGDRSAHIRFVTAIRESAIWTDVARRTLTVSTAGPRTADIIGAAPDALSDADLAVLRFACHDGLKCVAVDHLRSFESVAVDGGAPDWAAAPVRRAVAKITRVLAQHTTEYHRRDDGSSPYRYVEVSEWDDETTVSRSVSAILEDNGELCGRPGDRAAGTGHHHGSHHPEHHFRSHHIEPHSKSLPTHHHGNHHEQQNGHHHGSEHPTHHHWHAMGHHHRHHHRHHRGHHHHEHHHEQQNGHHHEQQNEHQHGHHHEHHHEQQNGYQHGHHHEHHHEQHHGHQNGFHHPEHHHQSHHPEHHFRSHPIEPHSRSLPTHHHEHNHEQQNGQQHGSHHPEHHHRSHHPEHHFRSHHIEPHSRSLPTHHHEHHHEQQNGQQHGSHHPEHHFRSHHIEPHSRSLPTHHHEHHHEQQNGHQHGHHQPAHRHQNSNGQTADVVTAGSSNSDVVTKRHVEHDVLHNGRMERTVENADEHNKEVVNWTRATDGETNYDVYQYAAHVDELFTTVLRGLNG